MKKAVSILLVAVILLGIAGCSPASDASSMGYDSVYHKELGCVISLGMKKDEVDKALGDSNKSLYYDYVDGISVSYADGRVNRIVLSGIRCSWVSKHDLRPRSNIEDVFAIYGEEDINSSYNDVGDYWYHFVQYYLDKNGESNIGRKVATISFELDDTQTKVDSIDIH